MSTNHKASFVVILSFIFLLPIFFIPGGALNLENAKSALLIFSILLALVLFVWELWQKGSFAFPRYYFLIAAAALPLIYLFSALLSVPASLSLFGYSFEVGTFGYMLFGAILLLLCSFILADTSRALQALTAFFLSLSLVAVLTALKIAAGGDFLAMGNFFGNMGNPIGSWTDIAIAFGLLSVFSALTLGMIPMRLYAKSLLYAVFFLSTALLIIINFSTAFIFTLITSVFLFFYFQKVESQPALSLREKNQGNFFTRPVFLPVLLGIVSLLFLISPEISETKGTLGNIVTEAFGVENTDVRPSFSATLDVSKAVLSQGAFLGSGPNTFSHDWLIYKPATINTTPFWATSFPFGAGFVPTQVASTGILGTALWLVFFILLIGLGVKALSRIPEARAERFVIIASLIGAFFLWAASFFYAPSGTVLLLAFFFSGLLAGALSQVEILSTRIISLRHSPQNRLASALFLSALLVGSAALGWIGFEKIASAYYFQKAVDLSNTVGVPLSEIENTLLKAVNKSPADIYYVALSRLNFNIAQAAANATTSLERNSEVFEQAVSRSIEAARLAVSENSSGYQNWVALGNVYSALVPKPLAVEGAYENARFAYNEAVKRNPNNPELYLLLAQLELNKGEVEAARSLIRNAIALKEDYTNAYLMLADLEIRAGNTTAAIASAERLALLVPNNPGLHFELGLLKYGSGDYAGAEQEFNQALVLSPDYANARYYLALTIAELGRFAEAQAEFESLLRTNPDNAKLEAALEAVRQGRKPAIQTP